MKPIFVTGIGTEVGKTVISATIVEKLCADYWKPVQSGDLDNSDTIKVKRLVSNSVSVFFPEAYRLSQPFSPHKSADIDGIKIDLNRILIPQTSNRLVIEGAGGLMVPLNEKHLMIDLIEQLEAEVILVSRHYLGSINHTLLSLEILRNRNIPLKGIIFNGAQDEYSESAIMRYGNPIVLGRIPEVEKLDQNSIRYLTGFIDL